MKNIIFDIGNVLVDWDWQGYVHKLFDSEEVIQSLNEGYWKNSLWQEMDRGAISQETIHRELLISAGEYRDEMELAYNRIGECITLFDYTEPWIDELHQRGYKVYYLSNYSDYLIHRNPEALRFTKMMDGGIFSCYVKLIKPDLAIYDTICKRYDLKPEESLFIDDKPINVIAAREFGMHAIHFENYEKTRPVIEEYLKNN